MLGTIKRAANSLLRPLGFDIQRMETRVECDPFWVQRHFIKNERPTIFDVGAHVGVITSYYRDLFPASTIHAFEPYPESFQTFKTRFAGDALIKPNATAVSDVEGTIEMNINAASMSNSILKTDRRAEGLWREDSFNTYATAPVPTTTIDAYCRAQAIESIDILKLDIQGAELKALQGARSLLEQRRVGLVYMELILGPTYQGQPTFEEYLRFFDKMGYMMLDLYCPYRKNFYLIQSDVIWVPIRES